MQVISREELRGKLDNNASVALIEVLGPDQYEQGHLPGAMNVPIGDQFDEAIQQAVPDKDQEVVVYCASQECQASPKAARRMDELGYQHVRDYEAGKADWKTAGLSLVT
jgi:rhodanese-related sulfurtransferase